MLKTLYRSAVATIILALITCGAYPAVVTVTGSLLFPEKSSGSLLRDASGKVIGSRLIAQGFTRPEYFHPRPSSAGDKGYDAANSSGSNLGPTNQKLADSIKTNAGAYLKENPQVSPGEIPVDAIAASASGLDPDISPRNAEIQTFRVAKARGVDPQMLQEWVSKRVERPFFIGMGDPTFNVLEANIALDQEYPVNH